MEHLLREFIPLRIYDMKLKIETSSKSFIEEKDNRLRATTLKLSELENRWATGVNKGFFRNVFSDYHNEAR